MFPPLVCLSFSSPGLNADTPFSQSHDVNVRKALWSPLRRRGRPQALDASRAIPRVAMRNTWSGLVVTRVVPPPPTGTVPSPSTVAGLGGEGRGWGRKSSPASCGRASSRRVASRCIGKGGIGRSARSPTHRHPVFLPKRRWPRAGRWPRPRRGLVGPPMQRASQGSPEQSSFPRLLGRIQATSWRPKQFIPPSVDRMIPKEDTTIHPFIDRSMGSECNSRSASFQRPHKQKGHRRVPVTIGHSSNHLGTSADTYVNYWTSSS